MVEETDGNRFVTRSFLEFIEAGGEGRGGDVVDWPIGKERRCPLYRILCLKGLSNQRFRVVQRIQARSFPSVNPFDYVIPLAELD